MVFCGYGNFTLHLFNYCLATVLVVSPGGDPGFTFRALSPAAAGAPPALISTYFGFWLARHKMNSLFVTTFTIPFME